MTKRNVVPANGRKSKFIERVLEAIARLAERSGSSAKDILGWLLSQAKTPGRNVTVQVQQALRQAVAAGMLRLRGGRYKIRCTTAAPVRSSLPPSPSPPSQPTAKNTTDEKRKKSTDKQRKRRSKRDKKDPNTKRSTTKPSSSKRSPTNITTPTTTTTTKKSKKTKPRPSK